MQVKTNQVAGDGILLETLSRLNVPKAHGVVT